MPFTRITVQEQYETSIGTPAAGSVEFTPVDQMHNGSLVISAPESDILDSSGNLSIVLAATTDPATTPVGVTYRVVERILGQPVRTYYVAVPHNQGSPLQLADLPSSSTGGTAGFALRNAIDYDDGTPPVDGQAMVWDSTTSKFHPESVSGVGSTVTAVNGQTGAVTVSPASIGAQPADSDLTAIAALAPADGSLLERVGGVWQGRTPAQVKGDLALDLVNNTPDLAKPVSTATQTALNAKAPLASPTFTGTVAAPRLVGNLVVVTYAANVTLDASAGSTFRCVATGNLAVTAINGGVQGQEVKLEVQASGGARTVTVNGIASTVASGEWGTWRLTWNQTTSLWVLNDLPAPSAGGSVTSVNGQAGAVTITATGLGAQPVDSDLTDLAALTPTNGDLIERVGGVWSARSSSQVKGDLALDQVNNTTDLAKPLSTAATAALAGKAPLADPVFTGTPTAPRFVGAVATVAYAAALTLNAAAASTHQVTATGDITSVAITGGSNGQSVRLQVFASGADRTVTAFGVATTVPSGTWGGIGWTYNQSSNVWIQDRTTITGGGGAVSSVNGQTGAVSVTATSIGAQPADSDLTVIAALGPTDGSVLSRQGGVWTGRTTAQVKTDMGIDLVDNTSDANKPISNAVATSLAAKAPLVSPALSNPTANRFIGAVQIVTYAASVTLDSSAATTFRVTATGPLTIADITNGANGQEIALEVLASGGDRVLTVGGSTITITAGVWWIGTLRYDQPRDTWKLTDSNGGTTGGSGGVPDDGSVTNAKVAANAGVDLDKTADSATRLAMTAAERVLLSSGLTERIQDDAAALLTAGVHTGVTATYVDTSNRVDLTVTGGAGGAAYGGSINPTQAPYNAAGNGSTDDTTALQAALAALDTQGYGVIDLGGRRYATGRLSVKPNTGIVNGTLIAKASLNDYVISLDGHATRYQSRWLLDNLAIDGNKGSNPTSPGAVLVSATGAIFDRPLIRNVKITNCKGRVINLISSNGTIPLIQPRLEHITIDVSETATTSYGIYVGAAVYDASLIGVDIGRCYRGLIAESAIKLRCTDVRTWGCADVGTMLVDSKDLTFVNHECDNNLGHGLYSWNTTSVHFVASAFSNNAFVDTNNEFGYGAGYNSAAGNTKDGAFLDQKSAINFSACRFVNEEATTGYRGEQRYGLQSVNGSSARLSDDSVFRNNRTGDTVGAVGSSAANSLGIVQPAVGRFFAGLGNRHRAPCRIVTLGDSITSGVGASIPEARWPNRLTRRLQAAYPSGLAVESSATTVAAGAAAPTALPGVHLYNGGISGSTSADFADSTMITNVGTLSPSLVIIMIGVNDQANGVDPATYQANVQSVVTALKAANTRPCTYLLVQCYPRVTSSTYPYTAYAQALASIAAADSDNVAFLDLSRLWAEVTVPGADPLLMLADTVHPNDAGHAFMADLFGKALRVPGAVPDQRVVVDSFARPDASTLGTADSGQQWTLLSGAFAISGQKVVPTTQGTVVVDTGRADMDVTCVVTPVAASNFGITVRGGGDDSNRLLVNVEPVNNAIRLYKLDTGVTTLLSTASQTWTAGQQYTVRVVTILDQVTVYVNGANRFTYTLTSGELAKFGVLTRAGLRVQTVQTGVSWAQFVVRDVTSRVVASGGSGSGVPTGYLVVYPAIGDDSDLASALASAPPEATLVAVKVAGT